MISDELDLCERYKVWLPYLIQSQLSTVIVRSSSSCSGWGTLLKKSRPVISSTLSTVTVKVLRSALLPFGRGSVYLPENSKKALR